MSNVEANNEMTQRFKKTTKGSKGDLFGTVDIKTPKGLASIGNYKGGTRES